MLNKVRDHAGIIGWIVVVVGMVWALTWQHALSQRIELEGRIRSHILCVSINDTTEVLDRVLHVLAAPREEDTEEEFALRQRLLQETTELLVREECPPEPP